MDINTGFGVIYLLTNAQHAARLVVSIHSLRKFFNGPVTVFSTRLASKEITDKLAADASLDVNIQSTDEASGQNAAYVTKPRVIQFSPYDATLFMDADTLVVGPITELVHAVQTNPLVVTEFCNWNTQHAVMVSRLENWSSLANSDHDPFQLRHRLDACRNHPLPAINAGVFGFQKESRFLPRWSALTDYASDYVLPDEMALQLLLLDEEHELLDTRFNCALAFMDDPQDARVLHFAATTHLTHEPSRRIWQAAYRECCQKGVGDIQKWSRFVPIEPPTRELQSWAIRPTVRGSMTDPTRGH